MSAAPAGVLPQLRERVRAAIGARAVAAGRACDEFVDAVALNWNADHWTRLARSLPESEAEAVRDAKVLIAKVQEYLEATWGESKELHALYRDVGVEVVAVFARLWFESMDNRTWMRCAIREARNA